MGAGQSSEKDEVFGRVLADFKAETRPARELQLAEMALQDFVRELCTAAEVSEAIKEKHRAGAWQLHALRAIEELHDYLCAPRAALHRNPLSLRASPAWVGEAVIGSASLPPLR